MAVVKLTSHVERSPLADSDLSAVLQAQRKAFVRDGSPSLAHRQEALNKIQRQMLIYKEEILEAISEDFGNRSHHETLMAEIFVTINAIKHARKNLKKWMKPKKAPIAVQFKPGVGKVLYQPLGVVGIISPWNYPFQLAIIPIVQALSAGNRIMLKPSELTPKTSALLEKMLHESFGRDEVAVFTGASDIGAEFSKLPFDHLFYTGSTKVGRLVMIAAADNLVPVTLELGGKSPVIVGADCPVSKAVPSIVSGKLLNAGQTCVAPDYAFVHRSKLDEFVKEVKKRATAMYPALAENDQFTSIVADNHYERICRLLDDAREKGATIVKINPKDEDLEATRKIAPTLVLNVTEDMDIMQEEIFGPVMPVMTYTEEQEAIDYINNHPRPLALYYFGHNREKIDAVVNGTTSGGVCVNDTLFHLAQEELPFGGVGPSGSGNYHGTYGFKTFSHEKAVFYQTRFSTSGLLRPPYGKLFDRIINLLIGK